MGLEQTINQQLNKYPSIKRRIKRVYQWIMYAISPKIKSEGEIERISPDNTAEYFFGYYDKSPDDATGRYVLCLEAENTWSDVAPKTPAKILLIDTKKEESDLGRAKVIATTYTWNVQQGCMMQWLGPDFDRKIIYNDFRDGKFCSVVLDVFSSTERVLVMPVYSVSQDGSFALTLDFARLHRLRPGYGYSNIPEATTDQKIPGSTAIWKLDIANNIVTPVLPYNAFSSFEPRPEMKNAEHKVNHIMLSPSGKRFMVLHRWFVGPRKYTRLITASVDGSGMYNLSDDDIVSHCYWKNDNEIIAYESKDSTSAYYLMKDQTREYKHLWPQITNDGHPSYSPDREYVVTDTYPNRARVARLMVLKDTDDSTAEMIIPARVFAPFKYDNDTRCDLHPRWSRDGENVYFDSVFEGHRGLYRVRVRKKQKTFVTRPLVSCVIPTYKRSDMLPRAIQSVLSQTYSNIEVVVVDDNEPNDEFSLETQKMIAGFLNNPRVRFIQQEKHINGAVARNVGIHEAYGKYVAFLDDDDEWLPEKIEKQLAILENDESISGATSLYVAEKGDKVVRRCPVYTGENLQLKVFMREVSIFTSTFIARKDKLLEMGGFDPKLLRHQDLQLFIDFLAIGKIEPVCEPLVILHTDSAINKPNVEKTIKIKEAFFESVDDEFEKYDKETKRRIKDAHYFEIVRSAVKGKKYGTAIKYLLKVGIYRQAYSDLYARYRDRK